MPFLVEMMGIMPLTHPNDEVERRDRPWIYRSPWAMVCFSIAGLLASAVSWNLLAFLGWLAATCGALAAKDARQRDVRRDF